MSELPVLNAEELMARLGGSRVALAQLVPVLTQSAATWQAELKAALAAGDAVRLGRAAHTAKGSLGTLAAPRAAAAAKAVEDLARAGDLATAPAAVATLLAETERAHAAVRDLL